MATNVKNKANISRILILQCIFTIFILCHVLTIQASICYVEYYSPVTDCYTHPLKIGYFAGPACSSLHELKDSEGKPNAAYARLNHPASYPSPTGTQYLEYSAGTYLSIKLSRQAHIHGIALQGSPDNLKSYLKSFELWYQTTVYNVDISKSANVISGFYQENGATKRFSGDMANTTKFNFANPFYAEELRIYPILFHGDKVFRFELYGCYLGKVDVPQNVIMGKNTTISITEIQNNQSQNNQYYLKLNEPAGNSSLLTPNNSVAVNYTFTSAGLGSAQLGLKYGSGWLLTDQISFVVIGPITGLQFLLDGSSIDPFWKTENIEAEFRLLSVTQPFQIKKYLFNFGDSTTCNYNYCRKKYSSGIYNVTATASNLFFETSIRRTFVACPSASVSVSYIPAVYSGGIGIRYLGSAISHQITVQYHALWETSYEAWLGNSKIQYETVIANGVTVSNIALPTGLQAPSQHTLKFNYTDRCNYKSYSAIVFIDEKVAGLSVKVNQSFKDQLIVQVPYFYKNHPVTLCIDLVNGTSVNCQISVETAGSYSWFSAVKTSSKTFCYNHTFTIPGNTTHNIRGRCWNRLNFPVVNSPEISIDVTEPPERMSNFSLAVSKQIMMIGETFYLYLIFLNGNHMSCDIASATAGISQSFTYNNLIVYQQAYAGGKKAYRLPMSTSIFSLSHQIDVTCSDIYEVLKNNVTIQAQVPVSGLSISANGFACLGNTLIVLANLIQGKPVHLSLYLDSSVLSGLNTYSAGSLNAYNFSLGSSEYTSHGRKTIYARAWNDVSTTTSSSILFRVTDTILSLNFTHSFTLSSSQARLSPFPANALPTSDTVTHSAQVDPAVAGYNYNWMINNVNTVTTASTWNKVYTLPGLYAAKLTVDGCNSVSVEANLTVVSPIDSYTVSFSPSPEVVVNKSATISITNAKHSECLTLDFGDSSNPMTHCSNYVGASDLNCFTPGSTCHVQHVYKSKGSFTIKVNATNALFQRIVQTVLVAKTCYNPVVIVQGDGTDVTDVLHGAYSVTSKKRSLPLVFNISSVTPNCEFSNSYSISWSVFAYNITFDPSKTAPWNASGFLLPNSFFSFSQSNHLLSMPCCTVSYGLLSVAADVKMTGHSNALGFDTRKIIQVDVTQTDLIASLKEKEHKIYLYNRSITFDGGQSSDPDQYATTLTYIWYCRDTVLESRNITSIPSIPFVEASYYNPAQPTLGCFGQSVGKIKMSSNSILTFNSKSVQENHTMEFTLMVQDISPFGSRRSLASRTILVLRKETPYFELSCSENCASKMDPSIAFALFTNCTADACADSPSFKWTLIMNNHSQTIPVPLPPLLYSKDTDKDLRMMPSSLLPDTNYTLHLIATGNADVTHQQSYSFMTNSAPKNGSCSIHPTQGVASFTSLSVICTGWIDVDAPLTYQLDYVSDYLTHALYQGSSSTPKVWFPKDIVDGQSNLTIRLRIKDALSMFKEVNFSINSNTSRCDRELYNPVTNCSNHPLRIGYYAYPECSSLHMLVDSANQPYVDYARLNHPASYPTGGGIQFYEYVGGLFLSIRLSKQARIHAVALQGSPNNLRYYVKSFILWYKTVIYNININLPSTTLSDFYKENLSIKTFQGELQNVTKFFFANPFFAEEVRILPQSAHVSNAFRIELYGCYLGRMLVSQPVGVNRTTTLASNKVQDALSTGNIYYYKVYEPDGSKTLLTASLSSNYTFKSRGEGSVELGLKHSSGWIKADVTSFIVYGEILGLNLLLNESATTPYKTSEADDIKFQLWTADQPYQIRKVNFSFGDTLTCSVNNCMKRYSRGLYKVVGTASNDFYQSTAHADVIVCPASLVDISFIPEIHLGGIGIEFLGPFANHRFSIKYFALWQTTYNVSFVGVVIKSGSLNASGWTVLNVTLPIDLPYPSDHSLVFNYTDACRTNGYSRTIYVDEKITSVILKFNQTFKDQLSMQVPYFFKNHSLTMTLEVATGTSVNCQVSIAENATSNATWYNTVKASNTQFTYTTAYHSVGDSTILVGGRCWNRLNLADVVVSPISVDVKQIPNAMTNFSLAVDQQSVKANEFIILNLVFLAGDLITCNVSYNGSGITDTYETNALLAVQIPYGVDHKAYRLAVPPNTLTTQILLDVTCRNIWSTLHRSITVGVTAVLIPDINVNVNSLVCFNASFRLGSWSTSGAPIFKSLLVDGVKKADFVAFNSSESFFDVTPAMITSPGWKILTVEAWNTVSPKQNASKTIRVARTIVGLTVSTNFGLSSPQALPGRPDFTVPANSLVLFNATVVPASVGYFFDWYYDGSLRKHSEASDWSFVFTTPGRFSFKLIVDGCNNFTYEKNLTVVSPIEDFNVTFSPSPEVIVNKSATISITNAKHSECLTLDFGDSSTPMTHCSNYVGASDLNCFTPGSTCHVQHVYASRGNFTVTVNASNGLYSRTKQVLLIAKTCYNPIFVFQGDGMSPHLVIPTRLRSSVLSFNITSLDINCEFSQTYSVSWILYSTGPVQNASKSWNDPLYKMPSSTFALSNGNRTAVLPCCVVQYGLISVGVKVSMTGHSNTAGFEAEKILQTNITQTPLVARMAETGHKDIQFNTTLTIDGSSSYDPDQFSLDLNYTWYCRDTLLESRSVFDIANLSLIDISANASQHNASNSGSSNVTDPFANKPVAIGCFGKSAGKFDVSVKTKSILFNTMNLQENHTIELSLMIEGLNPFGIRRNATSRTVLVRTRQTPFFVIRCTENCASKVDFSVKLFLNVDCKGTGGACVSGTAVFKWTMIRHDASGDQPIILNDYLYSKPSDKNFYMKPNVLKEDTRYSVHMIATAPDKTYFQQSYHFTTNTAPQNGSCTVDPMQGVAVFSIFRVNCSGWIDTELPLVYEVAHYDDLLTTVVCRHTNSSCRTILPIGEPVNSTVKIRVRVYDSLQMFTELLYTVEVTAPQTSVEMMFNLLGGIKNATVGFKAAQFIGAVSSLLNANETKSSTSAAISIQIRDASMQLLSRMLASSTDDVIAPLIAMIAFVPSEFSQASGNVGTDIMVTLTKDLIANQTSVIFRDLVSRSKSLLAGMGMLMKSTSVNLDPNRSLKNESNATENPLSWMTPEGRSMVLNSSAAIQSLVNTVFHRMSPVELPVHILTMNLGIILEKNLGTSINGTSTHSMMDSAIVMPSLEDMGVQKTLVIESLMKITTFNSYFWAPKSYAISSSLVEYSMSSDNLLLSVSNTLQPIHLYVARPEGQPMRYKHWLLQDRVNEERFNYHKLVVINDNSIHVEFKPMNYCVDFNIYIKYDKRPTRLDYDRNWTLPDLSSCKSAGLQDIIRANICSTYQEIVASALTYQLQSNISSNATFNCTLKTLLKTRIKEITSQCLLDPYRVFMSDSETRNGSYFIGIFEKKASISSTTSPPRLFNESRKCQLTDYPSESSYYIGTFTTKCRFWKDSSATEDWQSQGCQVGEMSNYTTVHCKCNHLTSFASDFFVAPNPINMDQVLAGFSNIGDNLSVLLTLSLMLALYIFLIVLLRKTDRKDGDKVGVVVIDKDVSKPYEYLIITVTGARANAGTTANVFCCLNSESRNGDARLLYDPEKPAFQRDQINAFKVAFEEPIGDLTDLRIWHDNEGDSPGWYLSRVYVEDLNADKRYAFLCEQWLATELEDGSIDRTVPLENSEDGKQFTHVFTTKAAKDLSDSHLWLSVVLKRPHDSFTRVQRLTCCVVVLCTTMLTSAMFFQINTGGSKYLWKIGSLTIDFKGLIIGIQSSFIVIPITAAVTELFRKSESFQTYKARKATKQLDGNRPKRKKQLPCGFIVVAWFLSVAAMVSSFVIVLFYSMQWGDTKSKQFLISVFTGFFQSAFVIQPLKLVVVALLLAWILKKNKDETDTLDTYKYSENQIIVDQAEHHKMLASIKNEPLTKEQLAYALKRRKMEVRLKLFLQDFLSYLLFLTFLAFVVRGYRDPDAFSFNKALSDDVIHQHFANIQDAPGLWSWVQNHFIPAIYSKTWYNGENFTNFKMVRNQEAFRVGLSRIRQLRIKPGTCQLDEDVVGLVSGCNDYYSLGVNEEQDFDVAWKALPKSRKKRSLSDNNYFDDVHPELSLKRKETHSSLNVDEVVLEDKSSYDSGMLKTGPEFDALGSYHGVNRGPIALDGSYSGNSLLRILKRERRGLKFKVRRKTISSTSLSSHADDISIDSQYLLKNGKVKPNPQHWKYNQQSTLRGFPHYGKFALYSGGGYVASLETDIDYARAVAVALEQDAWIDTLTRAVFFEFSVYNANLNFFATGFVVLEVLPTGGIIPTPTVRVFKLYRYIGGFGKLVMASEIILVLIMFFFFYKECRHMYRLGLREYFTDFWSYIEMLIAVSLFTAIILRGFSWYEADKIQTKLAQDPNQFISFQYAILADDALLIAVTIISFASTIKILKIISIFPTVVILKRTLSRSARPLMNYALPFCLLFASFSIFGNLVFWNSDLFNTYVKSLETQLMMLIGGSVYHSLVEANRMYGPIFFLMFAAFETFVFMNVFIGIIDECISESSEWKKEAGNREFVEYIEERAVVMLRAFTSTLETMMPSKREIHVNKKDGKSHVTFTPASYRSPNARKIRRERSLKRLSALSNDRFDMINKDIKFCEHLSFDLDNFDLIIQKLEQHVADHNENTEADDTDFLELVNALVANKRKDKVASKENGNVSVC